jgi:hypothetical protein
VSQIWPNTGCLRTEFVKYATCVKYTRTRTCTIATRQKSKQNQDSIQKHVGFWRLIMVLAKKAYHRVEQTKQYSMHGVVT